MRIQVNSHGKGAPLARFVAVLALSLGGTGVGWAQSGLPEGFELKTFAESPMVTYPVAVMAAPTGEVYVSVDENSSLDQEPGRGRIVRLVDVDGDGTADRATDFVPDIMSPRGGCYVDGTLYVVHPPFLSAFRDQDDDGVADQHDVLITGLGFDLSYRGADHTSNGARMGIDGWLYLAIGDYGFVKAVARDGSNLSLRGGGVLRVRPDGAELEAYSLYTRNIYDVAVSPLLDVFSRDNTNDGKGWNTRLHHFHYLADHGYPRLYKNFPSEALPPLADYGGGSGTGAYFLDEPGFPEDYNNKLYTCDFTTQRVYVHGLERQEATYRIDQSSFLEVKAIDMDADGNSRIYVSDWTNGGYRYSRPDVGSVSVITYPGLPAHEFPNLDSMDTNGLIDTLKSESAVTRLNAQQALVRRGDATAAFGPLTGLISDTGLGLENRVAALFTLKQMSGEIANPTISSFFEDPELAPFVLRALADRQAQTVNVDRGVFLKGLSSSDPVVQAQAVLGAARLGDPNFARLMIPLAFAPEDPKWLNTDIPVQDRYDENQALPHLATRALVALGQEQPLLEALDSADLQYRDVALRVLKRMHTDETVDGLILRASREDDPERLVELLTVLFRLYHQDKPWDGTGWWTTRPDDRGPYFEPIEWSASDRIATAVRENVERIPSEMQGDVVVAMRRNRLEPEELDLELVIDEVQAVLNQATPSEFAAPILSAAARDEDRDLSERLQAFRAIGRIPGSEAFDAQLAVAADWRSNEDTPDALKQEVEAFVSDASHQQRPKILRSALREKRGPQGALAFEIAMRLAQSPLTDDYMNGILEPILANSGRRPEFLQAIKATRAVAYREHVEQATTSNRRGIAALARETLEVLDAASEKEGDDSRALATLDAAEIPELLLETSGDVALGRELFTRQACIACHTVDSSAAPKGPFLGDAGSKWMRADLISSVLEPNAILAQGFQTQRFTLKDGTTLDGFVTGEADGVVQLRNVAGVLTPIQRSEVASQETLTQSMMPPGLILGLTVHEAASLFDYLQSLKQ